MADQLEPREQKRRRWRKIPPLRPRIERAYKRPNVPPVSDFHLKHPPELARYSSECPTCDVELITADKTMIQRLDRPILPIGEGIAWSGWHERWERWGHPLDWTATDQTHDDPACFYAADDAAALPDPPDTRQWLIPIDDAGDLIIAEERRPDFAKAVGIARRHGDKIGRPTFVIEILLDRDGKRTGDRCRWPFTFA